MKPTDPAFPFCVWTGDIHEGHINGLTKRELFAAMAMQGLVVAQIATPKAYLEEHHYKENLEILVRQSLNIADALIAELSKLDEKETP